MIIDFDEREFARIVERALPNAAELYTKMALLETHVLDRKNIQGYCAAALALCVRFKTEGASIDLSSGDLAVLERCLRFEAHSWQITIRPGMSDSEKSSLRAEADATGDLITKLRRARGLPA